MFSQRFLVFLFLFLALMGSAILAADGAPEDVYTRESVDARLERIKAQAGMLEVLRANDGQLTALNALLAEVTELRKYARDCVADRTTALNRVTDDLAKLGEAPETEDATVRDARTKLKEEKDAREQSVALCRLLLVNTEALMDNLDQEVTRKKALELTARFPGVIGVFTATPEELRSMHVLVRHHEHKLAWPRLDLEWRVVLGFLVLLGLGLIPVLRSLIWCAERAPPGPEEFNRAVLFALSRAFARYGGMVGILVLVAGFWAGVSVKLRVFVPELGMVLSLLVLALVLVAGRTFLAPLAPARHYLPFDEGASRRFWRAVRFLAVTWSSAAFLYFATFLDWPLRVALHLRFAYTLLFAYALARVVWQFFELSSRRAFGIVRLVVILVLATAVVAEIIGYRNLTTFLMSGVLASNAILGGAWLVSHLVDDLLESIESARYGWQRRFHAWMGVPEGGYLHGVFWFRLLASLAIWLGAAWAFVGVWGAPDAMRSDVVAYVTEGFKVGDVTIVPLRIVIGIGLLAVLFAGISWLRKQLDEKLLQKSRADVGARNAVSSLMVYIGVAIAMLLALSVAGVDLSSLAIIAGALSVGIGFGLQNIVNNFVSGLILLFERPIRQGDWVVVGTTEGHVKKISVRATQIQTFDNADVIVPNSELISSQVINWTLRDTTGRVRVPVGVAYGTDVAKVKEILMSIALSHPQTVVMGSQPRPRVLFTSFGDSALNFELFFFIRDVNNRLAVKSDINFEIDRAFREAGIAIPFPQTDVHLHYLPPQTRKDDTPLAGSDADEEDSDEESDSGDSSGDPGGTAH